jgi:lipid II:glycine glycyltransferase (peptidoglycan interpeptide bridge formation enzyme)
MSPHWNQIVASLPNSHFLQTEEWARVKSGYGWFPIYLIWTKDGKWKIDAGDLLSTFHSPIVAACLVLKRRIPIGGFGAKLCVMYAPKGPLLDWNDQPLRQRVLDDLQAFARQHGSIFLKLDPDLVTGIGIPGGENDHVSALGISVRDDLSRRGWRFSDEQIQFRNTVLIDLAESEDQILARMKQKTRYNIRLAEKKGVTVRVGTQNDFAMLYKMYAETSVRDGFVIRAENYYQTVWKTFERSNVETFKRENVPSAFPLIAEVDGEPVAAIWLFAFADRAYYVYGMSREAHREKMPNYLLQWEAIKRAKSMGCSVYDLWGAPDVFDGSDSMQGVFRFKEGLGGYVSRTLGAWDYVPNPLWYKMYTQIIPRVLDVMRHRGKAKTQQSLG